MAAGDSYDVFVSYSMKDKLLAEALAERLKRDGIRYWKAPESIPPGTPYPAAIAADEPARPAADALDSLADAFGIGAKCERGTAARRGRQQCQPVESQSSQEFARRRGPARSRPADQGAVEHRAKPNKMERLPPGLQDFGFIALIVARTILDTGARQPDSGKWTTPLFWWVAGLTGLASRGSSTIKEALNRRRQRRMLG